MGVSFVLLATACASPSGEAEPAELPEVSEEFGIPPTFNWVDGDPPQDLVVEVLEEGEGSTVEPGAMVVADYEGHVWGEDSAFDSSFDNPQYGHFPLEGVIQGWSDGIPGNRVGSRLLLSIPADQAYGEQGSGDGSIEAGDTLVFVVDLHASYSEGETGGSAQAEPLDLPDGLGITVDGELGEPFTISVAEDAKEPKAARAYPLSQTDGDVISEGDTVLISYMMTTWDNELSEASWDQPVGPDGGPQFVPVNSESFFGELEGLPVGSRALLVAPAEGDDPALAIGVDLIAAKPGDS